MIDPRRVGPVEVVSRASAWLSINLFRILGVSLAGLVIVGVGTERGWFAVPSVPTSVWVLVGGGIAGLALGSYPIYRTLLAIWDDSVVRLVELDPRSGDLSVWTISEERFSDLRVIDHKGEPHDASTYLNSIRLGSGELGYEVDAYDRSSNIAVSSWMAGARNREVRRHERGIDYIKKELSVEADKTLDQLINSNDVLRQQGKAVGMYLIKAVEGVQTPDSGNTRLYDQMYETLDTFDSTDELLVDEARDDPEAAIKQFVSDSESGESGGSDGSESEDDGGDGAGVEPAQSAEDLAISITRNGSRDGGGSE